MIFLRVLALTIGLASSPAASGQALAPSQTENLAAKVLVVYNKKYRESRRVADYYMAQRKIPDANRCAVDTEMPGPNNYMSRGLDGYRQDIKKPIQNCLNKIGKENILYIVFSYMTPFKVWEPSAFQGNSRAIDSLVADIWSANETLQSVNRYYREDASAAGRYAKFETLLEFRRRSTADNIYSVWRLDAASEELSKGLVDKAIAAETNGLSGQGCFDRRYPTIGPDTGYASGDWDIQRSADLVTAAKFSVTIDTNDAEFGTAPAPARCENAAFYGGWYSYGHYNDVFSWATGAMGWHLDSLSLENPHDSKTWSGGAIARGITITTGVVGEPFLENIPHLDSFFKLVLEGATVGDAMLRSTRSLSWMNVNVGDPLYAPFGKAPRLVLPTR
jgi:uncharacterized protein (TIGR03790 family)